MVIPFDSDLAFMFNVGDFAVSATLTPVAGSAAALVGIFDNALEEHEVEGAVPVIMEAPIFTCRSVDISAFASSMEGASLVVSGTLYIVREVIDDGTGVSILHLEKQ
jgi:hypothetical protein